MIHELKVTGEFFDEAIKGNRKRIVTKDDPYFRVGDLVVLLACSGPNRGNKYYQRVEEVYHEGTNMNVYFSSTL